MQRLRQADQPGGRETWKERIQAYLDAHPDRAFGYGDRELLRAFPGLKVSVLDWTLWALAREGRVRRLRHGRRVYFTSLQARREGERRGLRGLLRGVSFTAREVEEVQRAWGRTQ